MTRWPNSAPSTTPSTAMRRWTGGVMAARSTGWSRCSTPAGYRVAAADCLRRPGLAPDLREGHPVRSVAEPRGDRLLCLPDPPRCRDPRPRRPLALGYREPGPLCSGCDPGRGRQPDPAKARRDGPHPFRRPPYPTRQWHPERQPSSLYQRPQLRPPARARILMTRTEWPWGLTGTQFGLATTLFYVAYIACGIPSN